jgi:hypothetical protein
MDGSLIGLDWLVGVERVDLWQNETQFTLAFTSAEIREVRRYNRDQVSEAVSQGVGDGQVVDFFEECLLRTGYAAARTPPERGGMAAWVILN